MGKAPAVVVRHPGTSAPSTSWELYTNKHGNDTLLRSTKRSRPYYEGHTSSQKYVLAIKSPQSGELKLVEVPVVDVAAYSQSVDDMESIRHANVKNSEQRAALGEAFGTKRAKRALNSAVENRVEADMLDGLDDALVDTVKDHTANLPSAEERKEVANAERPIPVCNTDAESPEAAYPLENVVSQHELDSFPDESIEAIKADSPDSRKQILAWPSSPWINSRIDHVLNENKNFGTRIRLLVYISFLRAFYGARRVTSRQTLLSRLPVAVPDVVLDSTLQRFTISKAGHYGRSLDRSFALDPFHQDKLLCYMLVLMLRVDNWQLDVTPLFHELGLKPGRLIDLLKTLGCSVRPPTAAEASARELTKAQANSYRIAVLNAPVQLPETIRRRR